MSCKPSPEELEETKKSLSAILANDDIFQRVLDAVFDSMDKDENGSLDSTELHAYIVGSAEGLGVAEAPSAEQVDGIFKHLDLDSDRRVSKDELAVFLKHLFQQQLRQCELSLGRHRLAFPSVAKPAAPQPRRWCPVGPHVRGLPPRACVPSLSTGQSGTHDSPEGHLQAAWHRQPGRDGRTRAARVEAAQKCLMLMVVVSEANGHCRGTCSNTIFHYMMVTSGLRHQAASGA